MFAEGKETEPGYLAHWRRLHSERVIVEVKGGLGAPMTIVDHAIDQKRYEEREARRGRGRASDEYWCVFDVDQHPNIGLAIEKAQDNGIMVAVSNPCVELWFLLHFQDQTAHIERSDAQAASKRLLKCGKVLTPAALEDLSERHDDARRRAMDLDDKHKGDDRPEGSNPSSGMWRLIDRITGEAPLDAGG